MTKQDSQSLILKQDLLVRAPDGKGRAFENFPLRAGSYEHLTQSMLYEVATFLDLKGVRSQHTQSKYAACIGRYLIWLKLNNITDHFDEMTLRDFQRDLLNPGPALASNPIYPFRAVSAETADQYMDPIRSLIRHLHKVNIVNRNYADSVPRLGVNNQKEARFPDIISDTQWRIMHATLDALPTNTRSNEFRAERLRFSIDFSYAMGLRVHEFVSAYHANIIDTAIAGSVLNIVGKGRRARRLRLATPDTDNLASVALSRFREFLRLSPSIISHRDLPLFLKRGAVKYKKRTGTHIANRSRSTTRNWEQLFKEFIRVDVMRHLYGDNTTAAEAAYALEWEFITPHTLRHTRITHLIDKYKKEMFWVQKFAGHERIDTTAIYYHTLT